MKLADQSAFPRSSGPEPRVNCATDYADGMTYRQWLAGLAMHGHLSNSEFCAAFDDDLAPDLARSAIKYADALIAELEKEQNGQPADRE